jgi:hypothetical protein
MRTNENRARYDRSRLRYPSDLTDVMSMARGRQRPDVRPQHRLPMARRPKDLPPRSTLYNYFDRWNWDGTLERIRHTLHPSSNALA